MKYMLVKSLAKTDIRGYFFLEMDLSNFPGTKRAVMMRKFMVIGLSTLLLVSTAEGRKKRQMAGKVEDSVYLDSKHQFELTLPKEWKSKVHKASDVCRLTLTQKHFKTPARLQSARMNVPWTVSIPLAEVWVVQTPLKYYQLIDSLLSPDFQSEIKTKIIGTLQPPWDICRFSGFKHGKKKTVRIDGHDGLLWTGTFDYAFDPGAEGFKVPLSGALIGIENTDQSILLVILRSEPEFFGEFWPEVREMVESLNWSDTEH